MKHQTVFDWSEVKTDGVGNVVEMPLLQDKWCFGRPEVYIRQIQRTKKQRFYWGEKDVAASRCGRCKIAVACGKLSGERVRSSSAITSALAEWRSYCKSNGADRQFTGVAGRYWQRFLQAIADHGPWTSTNDEKLREFERERLASRRQEDARRKSKERERERKLRQTLQQPPTKEFIAAVLAERELRFQSLRGAAGHAGFPPSISKIPAEHVDASAEFTADVWMVDTLLREHGKTVNSSAIARTLIKMGRHQDKGYPALRQRVEKDLRRARDCEQCSPPLWIRFDYGNKLAASEIDQIMLELDDPVERFVRGW
ncbi:hypothetical protein KUW15_03030 [Qipengyuania aquimaris]|uniref:hypothetical protein n=1 Tax=Qipengyuania aquimaris TaxID=255984 RepID=UPI001C952399|nr:hypothetical protein [Qipengyuania aquimaris]MBY6127683.1 hypothetical protein [Qipengyuania aquimaris]